MNTVAQTGRGSQETHAAPLPLKPNRSPRIAEGTFSATPTAGHYSSLHDAETVFYSYFQPGANRPCYSVYVTDGVITSCSCRDKSQTHWGQHDYWCKHMNALEQHLRRLSEPRPRAEWVRGVCPQCGDDVVSNAYYVGGRGYVVVQECWDSLGMEPGCTYREVVG